MFDEALSGKVKLFRYLLNKNTCCTVIVTIELSVKSFLVISFFWCSEFHVEGLIVKIYGPSLFAWLLVTYFFKSLSRNTWKYLKMRANLGLYFVNDR